MKRGMCARDAGSRQNTEIFLRSFNRPAQIRAFLTLSQSVTGHRTAAPAHPVLLLLLLLIDIADVHDSKHDTESSP